ncbi:large-conductance mechanosensitive channel protein MscL [Cytophagales bacterium LB-30]|uniref:Large-conductance mechanosensitive channel n=1 Tax=Shiella aurantiaca TaxID=3058365 RepID=A0ABT8F4K8_9BACT|nr:large-conductance mechanosensitive channel protein MscL [Shiella aurantiaca]MDN4165335.1 large-conductance mechanosensitive channel protein MscL [Shiella aurantiaca]
MGFTKEFKDFAIKGNMLDMAIGIIIGSAFTKVVNSLVAEIIMPPLGLLIGKVDFKDFKWVLQDAQLDASGVEIAKQVSLNYGLFIQGLIDFLIVAFAVFLMVRAINRLKKKEAAKPAAPAAPPADIQLLTEIRDLLKK